MLTVLPTYDTTVLLFLIPGDTLFFLGDTLTQACNRTYPLQSVYGCDSLVDLFLNYADVTLSSSSQGGCPGLPVTLTAEGTRLFYWSSVPYDPELDSQQGQNPIIVHPAVTTVYQLIDASGNIITSFTVSVAPPPTLCIETNRDFIDFDYPVITLHDCSPDRYSSTWIFSDGRTLNGERARRQFSRPLPDTVTVTLHACNRYGCCTDTTIGFAPKIRSVWFPNIFTPDADNNNRFGCVTSMEVAEYEIIIFNRWGFEVWRSTDIQTLWDGTHDGTPMPQGAYVYRWYLIDRYGERNSGIGTVTLVR
jgi:gliding motility-associated-like protein